MNICVIGGGNTPGRFGKDFCDRAQNEGHDVRILSHCDYNNNNRKQLFANFTDHTDLVHTFNRLIADLDHIDIFLYNSVTPGGVGRESYKSTSIVNYNTYIDHLNVNAIVPHFLCIEALKKMDHDSKIIFITSGMADFEKYKLSQMNTAVAYAGGKFYQNFLMVAFANYNDKGATVASLSPYFNYTNANNYKLNFDLCYDKIINLSPDDNNSIITIGGMHL